MACEYLERNMKNMNATHYLICNPYSKLGNSRMGNNTKDNEKCFFEIFMVISNKIYERMARIANVSLDSAMNTVFITGYRGCGKTTFSKILQAIIDNRVQLPSFELSQQEEISLNSYDEKYIKEIPDLYLESMEKIHAFISDKMKEEDLEFPEKYVEFIHDTLKGISRYINFEVGINQVEKPVEEKLNRELKYFISDLLITKNIECFEKLYKIYKLLPKSFEIFKRPGKRNWENFFKLVEIEIRQGAEYDDIENEIDDILSDFNSNQLLCVFTLLNLIYADSLNEHVFLILDNIDVVFDISTLEDFTREFALFEENFSEIFPDICETDILTNSKGFYEDITYIFVMRETSATQVSDHFTDRLYDISDHFDISKDIKKRNIIEKKYQYIEKNKNLNKRLYDDIKNIRLLCKDTYVNGTIFSLFNNDYKRAVSCLTKTYKYNSKAIHEEIKIMNYGHSFDKHGARGIVYRLIFNHFKGKRYFHNLGLNRKDYWVNDFTPFRVILTYLNNIQPEHIDQFLTDDSDLVSLHQIYEDFINILSPTWNQSQHLLADALWSMYELRKSETWNHLITFDSVATVKKDILFSEFKQFYEEKKIRSDIQIRITCAGRTYVNFVCTHFEFFACRFSDIDKPLFSDKNLSLDSKGIYQFEKIISQVYNAVTKCCKKLNDFTKDIFINKLKYTKESLLKEKYVHHKEDRAPLFHEERIIHQHIGYIEAYRKYLIVSKHMDCIQINKRIVPLIENYLSLLKDNSLYGLSSKELYTDLMYCVKYIRDTCKFNNCSDDISRDGAIIIKRRQGIT